MLDVVAVSVEIHRAKRQWVEYHRKTGEVHRLTTMPDGRAYVLVYEDGYWSLREVDAVGKEVDNAAIIGPVKPTEWCELIRHSRMNLMR